MTEIKWTGKCAACNGSSNKYTFGAGTDHERPSRKRLLLSGKHYGANGQPLDFGAREERVEVCYACWQRWNRTRSFVDRTGVARKRALELRRRIKSLSTREIAGAVGRPLVTVEAWLSEKGASTRT